MSENSPMTPVQSFRTVGLAIALGLHGMKFADSGIVPTPAEVCYTADDFAEYIKTGISPRKKAI